MFTIKLKIDCPLSKNIMVKYNGEILQDTVTHITAN